LGGSQKLDPEAAGRAVSCKLMQPLDLPDVFQAAASMYRLALADMANNVRRMSIEKGYDPREFSLLCYGGAGGLFLAAVCALASVPEMIVPQNCAVFSALGALLSDYRRTALQSCPWRLSGDPRVIAEALDALHTKVMGNARDAGLPESSIRLERTADMRFVGQSSELSVPLPEGPIEQTFAAALRASFRTEYARAFGAAAFWADAEPEVVNLRVTAIAPSAVEMCSSPTAAESIRPTGVRKVFWPFDMAASDWCVRDRAGISPGSILAGPLIIESDDTTIVIPAGCTVHADASGNLIIRIPEGGLAPSRGNVAELEHVHGS
jgi:N-methylhydantoinase A